MHKRIISLVLVFTFVLSLGMNSSFATEERDIHLDSEITSEDKSQVVEKKDLIDETEDMPDDDLSSRTSLKEGWVQAGSEWNYYVNDEKAISKWIWAPIKVNGKSKYNWKYFDSNGNNINHFFSENNSTWLSQIGPQEEYVKGWWTNPENGYAYYFRLKSGTRVKGWQYIEGEWRYFRSSGTLTTKWQYIDGNWYYFSDDGIRYTSRWGWIDVNIDGIVKYNWKYFNNEGKNIDQFFTENGETWLSNSGPNREYQKGWWKNPTNKLIYYFRESGSRVSGWQFIYNNWNYFREQGTLAEGRQFINGKWNELGDFVSSTHSSSYSDVLVNESGKIRYYDVNGFRYRGWKNIEDAFLYFDNNGNALTGLNKIDDNYYFFNDQGKAYKGFQKIGDYYIYSSESSRFPLLYVSGWLELNGEKYYAYSDGKLADGSVVIDNKTYEFQSVDGSAPKLVAKLKYTDGGILLGSSPLSLKKSGSNSYYYDKDGNKITITGLHSIDGKRYYFHSGGAVKEGWISVDQDTIVYTNSDGQVNEEKTNTVEYGVDVSKWNGTNSNGSYSGSNIDFKAMKDSGIDFVILRSGYGRFSYQEDPIFDECYEAAKKAGLKVGVYHYSYAVNEEQAKKEAEVFLEIIEIGRASCRERV